MTRALVILVVVAAAAAPARADRWRDAMDHVRAGAFLHYELTGLTAIDDDAAAGGAAPERIVLAGARLHGYVGRGRRFAYHLGLDLAAGSTLGDAGFAYDVALLPLGAIVELGKTSVIGLGLGVSASGAIGTLDDAVGLPFEAVVELGPSWRVLARVRATAVAGAAARQDGAPSLPIGDELEASLGLRIGRHYEKFGLSSGNGYFVAASYREQQGARFAGLTIGYSIDLAFGR